MNHHELTVLQASCHGPTLTHRHIRFALSREFSACAVAFSEAYRHEAFLRDRDSWRVTMPVTRPDDDRDTLRGKGDAPVLVRRHHPLVAGWSTRAAHRSVPLKIAPPRYFNGQTFAHALGAVEVIGAHPHAGILGVPESVDRVQEYARSMGVLEDHVRQSLDKGRLPVVCGDLNYPDHGQAGPSWSPARVFARLGLLTWTVGVDWMAWDPRLVRVGRRIVFPAQNGQDHPWLWQRFTGFAR